MYSAMEDILAWKMLSAGGGYRSIGCKTVPFRTQGSYRASYQKRINN